MKALKKFMLDINAKVKECADEFELVATRDFFQRNLLKSFNANEYYVGITNDVNERLAQHKAIGLFSRNVGSKIMAGFVEKELSIRGFDVGARPANGGNSDTIFVYIYRKIKGVTIEDTNA